MVKAVTTQVFGVPCAEVTGAIASMGQVDAIHAAGFAYNAKLRDLERQFEAKAAVLRTAYLAEIAEIQNG
jgi:hypothetical protein